MRVYMYSMAPKKGAIVYIRASCNGSLSGLIGCRIDCAPIQHIKHDEKADMKRPMLIAYIQIRVL